MMGSGSMGGGSMGGGSGSGGVPMGAQNNPKIDPNVKQFFDAPKFMFKLQVIWRPQPLTARLEAKRKAAEQAAEEGAAEAENSDDLATNAE